MTVSSDFQIIRGGRVLDVARTDGDFGDILIEGDAIREVGPPGLTAPEGATVVDAADRLLIPGLINAHTHGHGGLAKGVGDRWTLELLLNAGSWISGNRQEEHKYLSALIGALEMVRKGCTACYDLYLELPLPTLPGMAAIAQAYTDVGMRCVVAPMIADRTLYEVMPGLLDALPAPARERLGQVRGLPYQETIAACRDVLDGWRFDAAHARLGIAPTIPLHCSDEFLIACRDLARDYGVGLHSHLAESKVQGINGVATYGKTITAHLDDLGILGPDFVGAHSVWLDGDDIKRLGDAGASVAHNPGSNMRLGSGLTAVREMVEAGVNVGIGTDGSSCSDNQNVFEAMRFASFVSRIRSHDYKTWLSTTDVFEMATVGSARVLGFGDQLGRLAPGAKADIVFLDLGNVNFLPLNEPINQLVHCEDGSAVDSVMVGGKLVLSGGQFVGIDIASIRRRVEIAAAELAEANRETRDFADSIEDLVGAFCIGLARQPYQARALAGPDY